MPLRLSYRTPSLAPVEVEGITPDALAGLSLAEIERLAIYHGNRKLPLAELFDISGDAGDDVIQWEGELAGVHWIGAHMKRGTMRVDGSAGRHLGSAMSGGAIDVSGGAGDWAGAEMSGGRLRVRGSAGQHVGAAYRGSPRGMTGGAILVDGDVGDESGASMRRGLIAIGGRSGDLLGFNMLAGTIVVGKECGKRPAAGMRRGSIVFLSARPRLLPTFHYACRYRPDALAVLDEELRGLGFDSGRAFGESSYDLYHGDFLAGGRGEVLVRAVLSQDLGASGE